MLIRNRMGWQLTKTDDVLGTAKHLVEETQGIVFVGHLCLCATFTHDARHVFLNEERFSVGILASGKREEFLDELVVLDGLIGLQCRIQP